MILCDDGILSLEPGVLLVLDRVCLMSAFRGLRTSIITCGWMHGPAKPGLLGDCELQHHGDILGLPLECDCIIGKDVISVHR